MKKLLVIDNYDSFTYNLVQMFRSYDLDITVVRNDAVTVDQAGEFSPDFIVISPGPGTPGRAGISKSLVAKYFRTTPILGVCLGMQCINEVFGGRTVRAPEPVHGKKSSLIHNGEGLFKNIPSPFSAARYHSLIIERRSEELAETSRTSDGIVMSIQHKDFPLFGVQFHPESFMTEYGSEMIKEFLFSGGYGW